MRISKLVLILSTLLFVVVITAVPTRADDYYVSLFSCGCEFGMNLTHNHSGCAGSQEDDFADMAEACLECPIRIDESRTVECHEEYDEWSGPWSWLSLKCPNNCPG